MPNDERPVQNTAQCNSCPHPWHVGPCPVLHLYDRPGGLPGNQQCMCGHPVIQRTITVTPMPNDERPSQNTDRELWREPHPDPPGSYYANSIHVTQQGGIGINVGGTVFVRSLAQWHALEAQLAEVREEYQVMRATLRAGLTDEQNITYPTSLDKAQALLAQRAQAREQLAEALASLPESHPAQKSGDLVKGVRDLVSQHKGMAITSRHHAEANQHFGMRDHILCRQVGQLQAANARKKRAIVSLRQQRDQACEECDRLRLENATLERRIVALEDDMNPQDVQRIDAALAPPSKEAQ